MNLHITKKIIITTLLLLFAVAEVVRAQTTVTRRCVTPSPVASIENSTFLVAPAINFVSVTDIPAGHVVADVQVEVVWSKTLGTCGAPVAGAVNLGEVGFALQDPSGVQRYFAPSTNLAGFFGTTASFTGTSQILSQRNFFRDNGLALPVLTPAPGATYRSNGSNTLAGFRGFSPYGNWQLVAIDDNGGAGVLCIEEICITLYTCPGNLTAVCAAAVNLPIDASGNATPTFGHLNAGSDTSCLLQSLTFTPSNFTCADRGNTSVVTMSITDMLGNSASCQTNVTIVDTTPPTITCKNYLVRLNAAGSFTMNANDSIIASDNCGVTNLRFILPPSVAEVGSVSVNCSRIGVNPLTLVAYDAAGNRRFCSVSLTVRDSLPPVPVCQTNVNAHLNALGSVVVNGSQLNNGSTDNCTIGALLNFQINGGTSQTYTCANLGANPARLIVVDQRGNRDSCNTTVTVIDTMPPVASCQNITAFVSSNGSVTIPATAINNASTDNCTAAGSLAFLIDGAATRQFTCAQVGSTLPAVLRVTDLQGNFSTCSANVSVADTVRPTALCQNVTAYVNSAGTVTVAPSQVNNASTDNCTASGALSLLLNGSATGVTFSCASIGAPQAVVLTVTDAQTNSATCTSNVTVLDTISPIPHCRNTITAFLTAAGNVTVTAVSLDSASTDNCGITNRLINGAASQIYTCAQVNTTQVATLRVQDAAGRFAECPTNVLIRDIVRPVARCRDRTVALNASGNATIFASDVDNLVTPSSDNCTTLSSLLVNGQPSVTFTCASVGTTPVILRATDGSGNTDSCTAQITIQDNTPPIPVCQNVTVYLGAAGTGTVSASQIRAAAASDNCGITSEQINGGPNVQYTCDSLFAVVGARTAVLRLGDLAGNFATCTASITVLDSLPPTANCRNITVQLGANGQAVVYPHIGANSINLNSADNCGIASYFINTVDSVIYDCTNLGSNTAELQVFDAAGNSHTCNSTVTVLDQIDPVARCFTTVNAFLSAAGVVTVTPSMVDSASTDNCGIVTRTINGQSSLTFTCASIATPTGVVLNVTDASSLSNVCVSTIVVRDTIRPTAVCNPVVNAFLSSTGSVTVSSAQVNAGSSDNCTSLTFTLNSATNVSYNCTNIGNNNVTLRATDGSGNTASCASVVNVQDTVSPVARCFTSRVLPLSAVAINGDTTITPMFVDSASTDNCSIFDRQINGQPSLTFNCGSTSPQIVTLRVADATGGNQICQTTITIVDDTRPVARCQNITITIPTTGGNATITPASIDNSSTDNCSIVNRTVSQSSFDCNALGANNVRLRVFDAAGNVDSCTAVVTVRDITAPVARCRGVVPAFLDATGIVTVNASQVDSLSTDNCSITTRTINGSVSQNYSCSNITATNNVTLVVTDPSGNTASCASIIQVRDTVRPTLTCNNVNRVLDAAGTLTVTAGELGTATDNCNTVTLLVNGNPSVNFTCANRGNNTVTIRATDANGNSVTCSSVVAVFDTTRPSALCNSPTVFLNNTGIFVLTPALIDNGSFDNCGVLSVALSRDTLRCADVGTFAVTMTVTDSSTLTNTCISTVTVVDSIRPVVICRNDTAFLDATGSATVFPADIDGGSGDACGINTRTINGKPFETYGCPNLGLRNVVLAVTDNNGNIDSCATTVLVRDTIRPTISCQPLTVQLDALGSVTVSATSLATAADNCNTVTLTINSLATRVFTCANRGNNTVTVVATDGSGNTTSCPSVVTVQDVNAPVALCRPGQTIYLNSLGTATVPVALIDNGSNDACGIMTRTVSPATVTCASIPSAVITLTVTDSAGLTASCQVSVDILDTVPPTMLCRPDTVFLDAFGSASAIPSDVDGGTVDACGLNSLLINGTSNIFYTCTDLGLQNVTLTGSDIYANTASCPSTILVRDTIRPAPQCFANVQVFVNAAGTIAVNASVLDSASTDNCSINTAGYLFAGSPNTAIRTFTCSSITANPHSVTLIVADGSGNTASCPSTITVRDTIRPTANCRPTPLSVNLNSTTGLVTVTAASINNLSADNCTIQSLLINGQPNFTYNCTHIGANAATLMVVDNSGNSSTCTATVTVNDVTSPIARCQNITVHLSSVTSAGSVTFAARALDNIANLSSDNCSIVSWQVAGQDSVTFDCSQTGNRTVSLVVRDSTGNPSSCTAIVTVRDTVRPIAICPIAPVPAYLNASGNITVTAAMIDAGSTDNCSIATRFINGATSRNFLCNNRGLNPVTLTVSDPSGNTATCPAVVEVIDSTPPAIQCQNLTRNLNSSIPAFTIVTANQINNGTIDNCGTINLLINGQAQDTFDCTNTGPNTVVLTATDVAGNISTCNAILTIVDNTTPQINCQPQTVYLDVNGQATVNVQNNQFIPVVATGNDGCGIINWTINGQSSATYTCDSLGAPRSARIVASDPSGNSATCQSIITVIDTVRPVARCQNMTLQLNAAGTGTVLPAQIDNFSDDNCALTTYLINGQPSQSYTCADVGQRTAILTVRDAANNQDTCTATITVEDNVSPVANCRTPFAVNLDANGVATVLASTVNSAVTPSTDACQPLTFLINNLPSITFNCSNVGPNPVLLTVQDANGNESQCPTTITVVDNTPPTALCRDTVRAYLDNAGNVTVTAEELDNNSFDNCGIANVRINNFSTTQVTYTCANVGNNAATLLVTGNYGNTASCPSIVRIIDTIPPAAVCTGTTVDVTNSGFALVTPAMLDPVSSSNDACGILSRSVSRDTVFCGDAGIVSITLTVTDNNNNSSSCAADVTVILQNPVATTNALHCSGDTIYLNSTPPANGNTYNFQWQGPNGFSATTQNTFITPATDADEGDYIITILPQGGGCTSSDTLSIDVNTVPIPVVFADTPACVGSPIDLVISNTADYSGFTALSYAWSQNGSSTGGNNDTIQLLSAALTDAGNYVVTVTADGCSVESSVFVVDVYTPPTAPQPLATAPCEGQTLTLTANAPDLTRTYSYNWSGPNSFSAFTDTTTLSNAQQTNAGTYTVIITDNFGCTATADVAVVIAPTPEAPEMVHNLPLCTDDLLEIVDTNTYAITPQAYAWTLPDNSTTSTTVPQLVLSDALAGVYSMIVNMNGCFSAPGAISVQYEPTPLGVSDAISLPFRDSVLNVNVAANDSTTSTYTIAILTPPNRGTASINADGTLNFTAGFSSFGRDTLTYIICNADCPNQCDTAQVFIEITADFECFIPDAISPNGDDLNDIWNIRCLHEYPNREVIVFSRWGNRVYEGDGTDFDGKFKGQDLPDGSYFYIIKLNSTQFVPVDEFKGYLIIHR